MSCMNWTLNLVYLEKKRSEETVKIEDAPFMIMKHKWGVTMDGYPWLQYCKIKKITLLGLNQFVLTSSLHSNHFHWAGEQMKTKEWDFFSVLLLLWLWTIFAWAKHQKYPIPCSPTPQKCLLHRLIFWFLWVTRHYVWPPYMLHELDLLLCTNKLFLTFLLR